VDIIACLEVECLRHNDILANGFVCRSVAVHWIWVVLLLSVVVNVRFLINARCLFNRQIKKRICIV